MTIMDRRRALIWGNKKRPDFIRAAGVDDSVNLLSSSIYLVSTDFVLKPRQTYSITARRRSSQFYTTVWGSAAGNNFPNWNGSQLYFNGGYINTAGLQIGKKKTCTFSSSDRTPFDETTLSIYGGKYSPRAENMDFYEFVITEDGAIVFDGIADFDIDGYACIHDIVSDKYYHAAGGLTMFEAGWEAE